LFICGGAEIYAATLERAERIYLTRVHADCDADTFFPEFNAADWLETASQSHPADDKNEHPFTFSLLVRRHIG
jgi:dihydrofolate reductase